ncbi:MAG: BON domain-containing protein [Chloroflexi bacterium]|nr:MAG: BON domain-containing protein [Chloroflexota bacterium]
MVRCPGDPRTRPTRLDLLDPARASRRAAAAGLAGLRAVRRYPGADLGDPPPLRRDLRPVTEPRRPDYLPEAIREKLIHDPRVAEQDLRVEVREHRVMVGGNVSSPQLKQRITEVAKELLPEYEVVNEVTVVPAAEPDGEEPVS